MKAGRFGPDACAPPGVFGPTLKSLPRWSREAVAMWPKTPQSAKVPQPAGSLLQKPKSGGGRGIYRGLVEGDMPTTILMRNVVKL